MERKVTEFLVNGEVMSKEARLELIECVQGFLDGLEFWPEMGIETVKSKINSNGYQIKVTIEKV